MRPEASAGRASVWVVDNGSTDGSPELVADRFPWVELVTPGENLGFGPAVNLVAERAPGHAWIAPANADIALTPGALETLLETGERDRGAGALAPRLVLPEGGTQHSVYSFPTVPFTVTFNAGVHRAVPDLGDRLCLEGYWRSDRARRVPWAVGAFLLVRREAWDAIGGFDERQWMYAEDLDLGWRLREAGWATRYEPRAAVLHELSQAAIQAFGDERTERWMRATYAWMVRRRGPLRTRATAAVNVAGAGARWVTFALLSRIAGPRWNGPRDANRAWARMHSIGLRNHPRLVA